MVSAQGSSATEDDPVLLPRSPQVGDDDDDDDGPDPFTDNDGTDSDGYDTPVPPTDNDSFDTPPPPTDNDGTDSDGFNTPPPTHNDGEDTPIPLDERSISGPQTRSWTVRSGDTLSQIAEYLGVPLDVLTAQTKDRGMIYPGQKFYYVSERQMDTPPPTTDYYDTPPPTTDNYDTPPPTTDNYDTPPPTTDNYDTPPPTTDNASADDDSD